MRPINKTALPLAGGLGGYRAGRGIFRLKKVRDERNIIKRGGTERNTSLHSGSVDSVQNPEAGLRDFESAVARAEARALNRDAVSSSSKETF